MLLILLCRRCKIFANITGKTYEAKQSDVRIILFGAHDTSHNKETGMIKSGI
jgi:hypothetical protein